MRRIIHPRIVIGSLEACPASAPDGWAVVHAAKDPCYKGRLGLVDLRGRECWLNLIDSPTSEYLEKSGAGRCILRAFLRFCAEEWTAGRSLLIHCNEGVSRAPALGHLWLACVGEPREPGPMPNRGLQQYINAHWEELVNYGKEQLEWHTYDTATKRQSTGGE